MRKHNNKAKNAFSLVELMIVVSILGILAAVVIPEFQNNSQKAKEAAAKDNLRILRNAIEVYAAHHNDVPPGYPNNDTSNTPTYLDFRYQLTDIDHILLSMAENPFNKTGFTYVLEESEPFPTGPVRTDAFGWIYKPATREIRLNWSGTDSKGQEYFDY